MDYVEGRASDNSAFVKQLEAEVALVNKSNEKWRAEYVKQYVHDRIKFKEGKKERDLEIAKSMLADDFALSTISKHTNLTVEDVEKLKADLPVEDAFQEL